MVKVLDGFARRLVRHKNALAKAIAKRKGQPFRKVSAKSLQFNVERLEKVAKQHGGYLPKRSWLLKHGFYYPLWLRMEFPEAFAHIPFKDKQQASSIGETQAPHSRTAMARLRIWDTATVLGGDNGTEVGRCGFIFYYRVGLDSVGTGQQLDLKPPPRSADFVRPEQIR